MAAFHYGNIDPRQFGVALLLNGQWWNWAKPAWETGFVGASHVLNCDRNKDFPAIQTKDIDLSLILPAVDVIDFIVIGSSYTPNSVVSGGVNDVGPVGMPGYMVLRR